MAEMVLGFCCILFVVLALVGLGVLIGKSYSERQEVPPTRRSDAAAASRAIMRLAKEGKIDEQLRAKLFELLRESFVHAEAVAPHRGEPAAPSPPRPLLAVPVPTASAPAVAEEPAIAPVSIDEEAPIVAEILAAAPAPPIIHPLDRPEPAAAPIVHPLDRPEPISVPRPSRPQQQRRALADVLQAFMQDKNIRWGELVSGLLIVGCSIALVISLRHEIESLSERFIYLPALLFLLATAAIHGAGNYTLRRWNLQATSRGVLIIATLLIPINFLAAIIITGQKSGQLPPFHPLVLSAVTIGILAFGTMTYFAGQALMREGSWRLLVGVIGTSAGQLLINRLADRGSSALAASLLVSLPLLAYLVATIAQLRVATRRPRMGMMLATDTLLVLGISSFSLAAAIGLLLSKSDSVRMALAWLSTPLTLPAVVILATGLALHRRVQSRRFTTLKTFGTSLALTGGLMIVAAVLLAWPEPPLLITVGLFSFTSLSLLAAVGRLPALHVPAIACGALACLIGFHLLQDSFAGYEDNLSRRMFELFLTGRSSVVLTVMTCAVGGAAGFLFQQGRRASAISYLAGCGGIACLSVLLAIAVGFWGGESREPNLASPVLLFYAVTLLVASYAASSATEGPLAPAMAALTWIGSTLLLVSFVHGCGWNSAVQDWLASVSLLPARPILVATLAHGIVAAMTVCLLAGREPFRSVVAPSLRWQHLIIPLRLSALASSVLALPWCVLVSNQQFGQHAWYMAGLSLIWLAATVVQLSPLNFSVFQSLATVAVVFTTASVCQQQSWWSERLYTPRHLQTQFGTLAVWCLAWSVGRRLARRRWPGVVARMRLDGPAVDEFVFGATVIGMFLLCIIGCGPGVAIELGFREAASFEHLALWQSACGVGAWIALMLLIAAAIGSLIERFTLPTFSALFISATITALLLGGRLYDTLAVASGLRWSFALWGVVLTSAVCLSTQIAAALRQLAWLEWGELPRNLSQLVRTWTLSFAAIPILGLTTASLVQAATGHAPHGPIADSFFDKLGSELSYGVPLGLLAGMLIAHAIREKKTRLMLAGSGVFQYLVNLAFFLPILKDPTARMDWPVVIGCLQWNSLGLAAFALAWLGARRWVEPRDTSRASGTFDRCLVVQVGAAVTVVTTTTGLASVVIIASPDNLTRFAELGSWLSYLVCLLGFCAAAWLTRSHFERFGISLLLGFLFALGGPVAVSVEGTPGDWRAFHVLMLVWLGVAMAGTVLAWLDPRRLALFGRGLSGSGTRETSDPELSQVRLRATSVQWATGFVGLSVLLALRGTPFDPATPWWPFATTLTAAVLAGALGFRTRRQAFAYASTVLAAVAVTIVWWGAWPNDEIQGMIELAQLNMIAVVAASLVWLLAEVRSQRRSGSSFEQPKVALPVQHATAIAASVLLFVIVLLGFGLTGLLEVARSNLDITNLTGWILLALLGGLVIGSLWDERMTLTLQLLYVWGLLLVLMALDEVDQQLVFQGQAVFVLAGLLIAAYIALTGHAWKYGANLAAIGNRLGMPETVRQLKRTRAWLPVVTLLVTAMLVLVELVVVLAFRERWMRVGAAFAPLLLAYGVSCQAQQQRRTTMQYVSLLLASLSAVYAVWADIEPTWRQTFALERAVRLLMVLAALAFIYAIPLSRWTRQRGGDWFPVVRRMALHCAVAALAALSVVLLLEWSFFKPGVGVPFGHAYEVVAVAVVLVGLIIAFLALALSPARDPLSLSEQGRMGYVYAAQVVGALLFAHLYLSDPQMFGGLKPYWPYIVMGIAFAGVGVGEVFQRSGWRVLAEPLQRTGGFLPLLPALGWWVNRSLGIDTAGHYSLLLFFAGLLYVALSMLRRSAISGLAAALAGNAALWALLADYEPLSLLKHPQFWLIPPAVSTLVAAQINRRGLSESQLTGIRYLCLMTIYVSSTADIFIEGIGTSLWEPMLLATLSVIGVFVGIGLQIRAFLYLGATFVFMSVVSMVWHAYAKIQHVGIWWGFGILLGMLILTIFGLFEKKRPELTRLVEGLRQWEH